MDSVGFGFHPKTKINIIKKQLLYIATLALVFTFTSCSEFGSDGNNLISPQILQANVESFYITPVNGTQSIEADVNSKSQKQSLPQYYKIAMRFDKSV